MAHGVMNEITPWRRRSLTIPPDSWRAWVHLAVWEVWMGILFSGFLAFGVALIASSGDRIVTIEDLSGCYAPPPVAQPCERIVYRTGALNAAFTALGGLLSLVVAAWFVWELWSAVAPKPITDDFLKLLQYSFGRNWRDPRTWPWSRMLWAYGFTFVGVLLAAGTALLIWTAISFSRPVKTPVVNVETSQDFRVTQQGDVIASAPHVFLPGGVMSAHLAADLAVTLDSDRPGALAKALGCVSTAGINIDGYSEMNGIVHILATDLAATRDCLHRSGFRELQKQEVVVVPVEDEPGAAAGVFQRIADAHINVRYTYLATGNRLVIAAGDPQAVMKALMH